MSGKLYVFFSSFAVQVMLQCLLTENCLLDKVLKRNFGKIYDYAPILC